MKDWRKNLIEQSNNPDDKNKNICALAITDLFKVSDKVRYLHTCADVIRAIRKRFPVRCIHKNKFFGKPISSCRSRIRSISDDDTLAYVIFTFERDWEIETGHLILLNRNAQTVVDTCEVYGFDSRKIIVISEIRKK
jgi:hypothetical protein